MWRIIEKELRETADWLLGGAAEWLSEVPRALHRPKCPHIYSLLPPPWRGGCRSPLSTQSNEHMLSWLPGFISPLQQILTFHASETKLNTVRMECREAVRQTASFFLGQSASAGEELAANLAPIKDGRKHSTPPPPHHHLGGELTPRIGKAERELNPELCSAQSPLHTICQNCASNWIQCSTTNQEGPKASQNNTVSYLASCWTASTCGHSIFLENSQACLCVTPLD